MADAAVKGGALRERLLTSALLVPAVVAVVLFLPTAWFAMLMGVVVLMAAWEWALLSGAHAPFARGLMVALVGAGLAALWVLSPPAIWVLLPASIWWIAFGLSVLRLKPEPLTGRGAAAALLGLGLLVLITPWFALVTLHGDGSHGPELVLALLMLIWLADSSAYFGGRRFGKRKLAPRVSPGKTWEGLYAALGTAALAGGAAAVLTGLDAPSSVGLILLVVVTVGVSVLGDLCESWLKRCRGLKDSGAILPGHGGILDRIDSMTAAAPVFVLGLTWLGVPA